MSGPILTALSQIHEVSKTLLPYAHLVNNNLFILFIIKSQNALFTAASWDNSIVVTSSGTCIVDDLHRIN